MPHVVMWGGRLDPCSPGAARWDRSGRARNRSGRDVSSLPAGPEFDPPAQIDLGLHEALDLLAALEDAGDVLIDTDHRSVLAKVEHHIQVVSRTLGFEQGGSDVQ